MQMTALTAEFRLSKEHTRIKVKRWSVCVLNLVMVFHLLKSDDRSRAQPKLTGRA